MEAETVANDQQIKNGKTTAIDVRLSSFISTNCTGISIENEF